jgi:hypothetical protein
LDSLTNFSVAFPRSPIQIKRFESGASQLPLDVIKNLAKVWQVSSDELIFGEDERQPSDDLKLQFCCQSLAFPKKKRRLLRHF